MKGFGAEGELRKKKLKKNTSQNYNLINLAINLHSQGKTKEASKYYRYCIKKGFDDPKVFSNYGIILQSEGKLIEAEVFTRKAIKLNPNFADAYSNLGNILKSQGKLKEAEISYRNAIKINPNFINAHFNLGNTFKSQGKLKEAEISYRRVTELKPNYAAAHFNLGDVLKDIGKWEEAEISYRNAIKLNSEIAEAHLNLGNILQSLGKWKEAESSTRRTIELNPNFAEAHLNLGNILQNLENFKEAENSYRRAIELKPNYIEAHLVLAIFFRNLGKLKEAEFFTRKVIKLNPRLADAYSNLGGILISTGQLEKAKLSLLKAIDLNHNFSRVFYLLSTLNSSSKDQEWQDRLFSEHLLKNLSIRDQIFIYFARANILHKDKNFKESAINLKKANDLKSTLNPTEHESLIKKSKDLFITFKRTKINEEVYAKYPQSIFIVGMPRSGSTLVESILSMNPNVQDLEEINILEESFNEIEKNSEGITLAELYWKKVKEHKKDLKITTNKYLYNYQYAGLIASQIPNVKIIHCVRNPLDNILSIYRTHFTTRNKYCSSVVDCSKIYLDQENIMNEYKKIFPSKIYDLNYDLLVSNPIKEIKDLISYLGWPWNDFYLNPHLNERMVTTASVVQVRSPINSNSVGGWKNYKDLLKPAIDIINKYEKLKK